MLYYEYQLKFQMAMNDVSTSTCELENGGSSIDYVILLSQGVGLNYG